MVEYRLPAVNVIVSGKLKSFSHTDTTLTVTDNGRHEVPLRQVLAAHFHLDTNVFDIWYLRRKKKGGPLSLVKIEGTVKDAESEAVEQWVDRLLSVAYEGVKRNRRLKVLVNPHGGVAKGASTFAKVVEPIFRAAECTLDVIETTHNRHAYEIAKELPLKYDVVVSVSGDGLVHEILNGFAHHERPMQAFAIPVAPIPTGSGNGLSLNLIGLEDGMDVAAAALNVIKGLPMKVDVFSMTQNGKRTITYMSQALGLMADLDLGTEHLRWMGDTRFTVGLLRGIVQFKTCPVQLSYKAAEVDKMKMAEALEARHHAKKEELLPPTPSAETKTDLGLPELRYSMNDTDGWTTMEEPLLYVYAGKGPYVSRSMMAFPVSLPNDGLIDIAAQTVSSRTEILASFGGAIKADFYWNPSLHYVKAHAYRVKPLSQKGFLSVDGEDYPFEEFQVEVHEKLATFLSPYGYYAAEFHPKKAG